MAMEGGNEGINQGGIENEFNDLQKIIGGSGEAPEAPVLPEKIGELPVGDFEKLLGEASGGKLNSYSQFNEVLTSAEKLAQLEAKLGQLETERESMKGGLSYANQFTQKVDELYKAGVSDDEIQKFIQYQKMDFTSMSDIDVLKMKEQNAYPGLNSEQIDALIEEKYGDGTTPLSQAKILKDAIVAKAEFEKMKVDLGEPESIRLQKAKFAENQMLGEKWMTLLNQTSTGETHSLKLTVEDKQHQINIPMTPEERSAINTMTAQYAVQNGIPRTAEGYRMLTEFQDNVTMALHWRTILPSLLRGVQAETKQGVLQNIHNVEPIKRGSAPTETKTPKPKTQAERIAEQYASGRF